MIFCIISLMIFHMYPLLIGNNIELFNFIFSRSTQLYFMYVHFVLHIPEVSFSFSGTLITCRRGQNTSTILHGFFSILPSRLY